jgi:hypothetical protein
MELPVVVVVFLGHLHAAELLLNFSYSPLHAMGEIELNPILSQALQISHLLNKKIEIKHARLLNVFSRYFVL